MAISMGGQPSSVVHNLLRISVVVVFALPLVWMLAGSLKPPGQPESELLPREVHWQNYRTMLVDSAYLRYLANSIVLSVLGVAGTVVSGTIVAYGFAKLRWPGRDALFLVLISTMLLPFHVTMLPRFQMFAWLGMYDTYWPLVLPNWLAVEAFSVFLLRQYFLSIPEEISQAARLDGAGEWTILTRLIVPLSWPALATVALFQFMSTWNEFGMPLLYLNDPDKFPLAYALQQFVSAYRTEFGPLMAGAVMFTLPVLILFLFAQRTLIQGLSSGGIKGN